ncbi:flagellar protein FlaG [uncultured Shewanella sp.]|uniref:flagellar protein FlaG n=1 Tax=uncultured Shewanella sp. TaxID=173975 RepID=UPI00261C54A7|nr:flagellar protein FlaG [uncultured Shewanella sp.]
MTMDVSYAGSTNPTAIKLEVSPPVQETEKSAGLGQQNQSNDALNNALVNEESETQQEMLHGVVNELTDMMSLMRKGLAFKVDEYSGQSVVSVMDVDSGDVIRQIPNEEALELAQKLAEVAGSLLKTEA